MSENTPPQEKKRLTLKNKISQERVSALHDLLMPLKKQIEDKEKNEKYQRKERFVKPRKPAPDTPPTPQTMRQESIQHTLDWLYATFPQCFDRASPRPLKRRIEKDIYPHLPEDQSISRLTLRRAIAFYTRWVKYRKALTEATHRYDLEGKPVEEIQGEHKERAEDQVKEHTKRHAEKMRQRPRTPKKPFKRFDRPKPETPTT